jgi:hypothetical protein
MNTCACGQWPLEEYGERCPSPGCGSCEICGEQMGNSDAAEMYDRSERVGVATYCHAECGLENGLEVA